VDKEVATMERPSKDMTDSQRNLAAIVEHAAEEGAL
jgi:hypothetical protein